MRMEWVKAQPRSVSYIFRQNKKKTIKINSSWISEYDQLDYFNTDRWLVTKGK